MYLKSLLLCNFRNYKEEVVHFSPKVNWIYGNNAQGKTNLLEAICLLSIGRSFRTQSLEELIRQGSHFFYLEAEFFKEGVSQTLKILFDQNKRQIKYNETIFHHFSHLLGLLPTILYAPEDYQLISGFPEKRRKFLDLHLAQLDPTYVYHLSRYLRAVKQRNDLLRKKSEKTMHAWEQIMALSGSYLISKRQELISHFASPLSLFGQKISQEFDALTMQYRCSFPLEKLQADDLSQYYSQQRKRELYIGNTLFGPHRDDLGFLIKDRSAKQFSSEGQKHSYLAALRLAQWKLFESSLGDAPLMCIDDFAMHLDAERTQLFGELLFNLGQVFLTSPHLPSKLPFEKKLLHVQEGKVSS